MKNLDDIRVKLAQNKQRYSQKYGVSSLGIFGSYSRGDFSSSSDIDILVEFERPIGLAFVNLADDLEKLLNAKVDLISKKAVKPRMLQSIENDLIYV